MAAVAAVAGYKDKNTLIVVRRMLSFCTRLPPHNNTQDTWDVEDRVNWWSQVSLENISYPLHCFIASSTGDESSSSLNSITRQRQWLAWWWWWGISRSGLKTGLVNQSHKSRGSWCNTKPWSSPSLNTSREEWLIERTFHLTHHFLIFSGSLEFIVTQPIWADIPLLCG